MNLQDLQQPLRTRYRFELLVSTWLSYAGFYVTRKVFSVVKGPIKRALSLDDLHVSYLWTVFLVTYMLGMFVTAWLSRRMTSRGQVLLGMGISVMANVAMGLLLPLGKGAYGLLFLTMGLHGFGQSLGWPNNVILVGNWTRRAERGRVMAVWSTCYQIGAVAAKAFAAFLFAALGLLWSFWGSSLVLAGIWGLFFFWGRERPEASGLPAMEPDDAPDVPSPRTDDAKGERVHAPDPTWRLVTAMGTIYFSFKFLRYALDSWTSRILEDRFAVTTEIAGYISTTFDWVGFLGVLFAGWFSDRFCRSARVPVIFAMGVGMAVATVLLTVVGLHSLYLFAIFLGLTGFMAMGPDSLLSGAAAVDVGSRKQAAVAVAIINGLGSIGPIVQEPVIGWLKTYRGDEAVLLLLVGISFLAALGTGLFWITVRKLRRFL